MKLEAEISSRLLQVPQSVAKTLKTLVSQSALLLVALSLLVAVMPGTARAASTEDPITIIRKLSAEKIECPLYAQEVAKLVKAYPKQAEAIIAEAVKGKPTCACEVVKQGIIALTPTNGSPDPHLVASVVATVVQYIQASNPELLETIVSCATEVAKDAAPDILAAIANIYNGPKGDTGATMPPGSQLPTATPTPTPPKTPTPVTDVKIL